MARPRRRSRRRRCSSVPDKKVRRRSNTTADRCLLPSSMSSRRSSMSLRQSSMSYSLRSTSRRTSPPRPDRTRVRRSSMKRSRGPDCGKPTLSLHPGRCTSTCPSRRCSTNRRPSRTSCPRSSTSWLRSWSCPPSSTSSKNSTIPPSRTSSRCSLRKPTSCLRNQTTPASRRRRPRHPRSARIHRCSPRSSIQPARRRWTRTQKSKQGCESCRAPRVLTGPAAKPRTCR